MEKDIEAHRPAPIGHFKRILNQGVVNSDIQNAHYPGSGTEVDPYTVSWLPQDDPVNPMNFSTVEKWVITMSVAVATLVSKPLCLFANTWLWISTILGCAFWSRELMATQLVGCCIRIVGLLWRH